MTVGSNPIYIKFKGGIKMSKVTIEFTDEEIIDDELQTALDGWKYKHVIYEVMERFIRHKMKYDETTTNDQQKLLDELREFVVDELNSQDLTVDSVYK
jgi:hypothetical protein